ncbi:MAG: TauD/TfdA family dioxygenase [Ignavibacteriaceae bacterium]
MNYFKKIDYKSFSNASEEIQKSIPDYQLIHLVNFTFDVSTNKFYESVSNRLGEPQPIDEDKKTGSMTGERWIDITFDPAEPNKYRSSKTRQPFHTDDSYIEVIGAEGRVTFFYCESQADIGGATTFLKSDDIIDALTLDEEFQLLEDLQKIPVKFSKADSIKVRSILNEDSAGKIWTWNWHCVDENNSPEALDVAKRFHDFLENRILMAGLACSVHLLPGEAVFFHDHRLLHGRNAFFTKEFGGRKLIKGAFVLK